MATFEWNVSAMDCLANADGKKDVVTVVHWSCVGSDSDLSDSVYSTCAVPAPEGQFTDFAALTKEMVLGWVWANGVDKQATEAAVAAKLDDLKNPKVVSKAAPW